MGQFDRSTREALKTPVLLADALVGVELAVTNASRKAARISELAALSDNVINGDVHSLEKLLRSSATDLATDHPLGNKRKPFHWVIEFPEVFRRDNSGFDAFVGNPPFLGGQRIKEASGGAF